MRLRLRLRRLRLMSKRLSCFVKEDISWTNSVFNQGAASHSKSDTIALRPVDSQAWAQYRNHMHKAFDPLIARMQFV